MLLKSSRRLIRPMSTICCRSSTYPAKKLNVICSHFTSKSPLISLNFTRDCSIRPEKINDYWIGSKPGDGLIRGRAASSLQDSLITDFITCNDTATDEDWKKLIDKVFQVTLGSFNEKNIDGKILDCCYTYNNFNLARNYLQYIRNAGKKYNASTVCSFIKLCYLNRKICTKEDLAKVDQFTRYLLAKYKVFDQIVGEAIVKGLSLQGNWQKAGAIIAELKEYLKPTSATISAYATCLLNDDQVEKAWSIMTAAAEEKFALDNDLFLALIERAKSEADIEQLLKFFQLNNIIPKKIVCDHLISVYSQFPSEKQITGNYVSIDSSGKCPNCRENLQRCNINDEEFKILRDEFLNRVLIRNDVFKNTSPQELKDFFKIVKRNAPFDIVIDGLNVMYMSGTLKSERVYSTLLTQTVHHFVERNQKVLVIGRKHMYNFTKENLSYVRKNSTLFFINDLSEDDPFMIYATIYSGPQSCFVTRDLMRSEKFKLSDEKLALLFKRWQQSHQIFIEFLNSTSGRLYLKNPIMFEMAAQPSKFGWHIPYHLDTYSGTDDYGLHEHWLCMKK